MSENLQVFRIGCRGFENKIQIWDIEAKNWKEALQVFKAEMPDVKPVLVRIK